MSKTPAQSVHTARTAAAWEQKLEGGMSKAENLRYVRWLKQSPAHVRAMLFLHTFCEALRPRR